MNMPIAGGVLKVALRWERVGKPHVWKPFIGWYFFAGGLSGGSSLLGLAARASGNRALARNCSLLAFAGIAVSPPLLIADLGRPRRFLNMLRVFKPTSPMSVGTWVVSASGAPSRSGRPASCWTSCRG